MPYNCKFFVLRIITLSYKIFTKDYYYLLEIITVQTNDYYIKIIT